MNRRHWCSNSQFKKRLVNGHYSCCCLGVEREVQIWKLIEKFEADKIESEKFEADKIESEKFETEKFESEKFQSNKFY